jgi:hypothetical protein
VVRTKVVTTKAPRSLEPQRTVESSGTLQPVGGKFPQEGTMILVTLSVAGTCPGAVDVAVSGATPGGQVVLVTGDPGAAEPWFAGPCNGTVIDLAGPDRRRTMTADALGNIAVQVDPRLQMCGHDWQVLDVGTCKTSNVVSVGCSQTDLDGDGFDLCAGDCNENDATVHPAAVDTCGDGVDTNCSGLDASCAPVGSFRVIDGPPWTNDPRVFSCVEACAEIFALTSPDPGAYDCSTSSTTVDFSAFVSGWADATFCTQPVAQDFSKHAVGDHGYNCGFLGCSYSAYVLDVCGNNAVNQCWLR